MNCIDHQLGMDGLSAFELGRATGCIARATGDARIHGAVQLAIQRQPARQVGAESNHNAGCLTGAARDMGSPGVVGQKQLSSVDDRHHLPQRRATDQSMQARSSRCCSWLARSASAVVPVSTIV